MSTIEAAALIVIIIAIGSSIPALIWIEWRARRPLDLDAFTFALAEASLRAFELSFALEDTLRRMPRRGKFPRRGRDAYRKR